MTDSNRTRIALVRESTFGALPASARLRPMRITGETLRWAPQFLDSNEFRSDRMTPSPVKIFEQSSGALNFEFSYPLDGTALSEIMASAFFNNWVNTPQRYNDGVADSVITDIGTTTDTAVFTTGSAFVAGHLILNSGFTAAANNGLFPVTTGGTTSLVSASSGWSANATPAATARIKVVGVQGASGDLVAVADGITSTAMNFTTMGFAQGQWIKIGGTGSGFRYTGAVGNNAFVRVLTVAANKLTLDHLPSTWTTDTGAGKTLRIFFGDTITNGITRISMSVEKGFLGQTSPTYILQNGLVVGTFNLSYASRQMVTGSADLMGTTAAAFSSAQGTTYDNATTEFTISTNAGVGRVTEAGSDVIGPNYIRSFTFQVQNNLRTLDAMGYTQAVDVGAGDAGMTGTAETYYGSNALYTKLLNGTPTSLSIRGQVGSRATVLTLPYVIFTDGSPNATARNTDVTIGITYRATIDPVTGVQASFSRFDYYES